MLIFLCLMTAFGDLQILAQTNNASVFSILPLLVSGPNAGTGIVIFNPTAGQVSAVVTAKNADGGFLSNSTVTIPPFGQVVTTAAQLFPAVTLSQGSLSIASATNGLVAYYSTFGNASGDGIEGAASATELLFPIVTGPSEGTSEINLQNPNTRPTTAELKLWSFAGNLLGISELYIPAGRRLEIRTERTLRTRHGFLPSLSHDGYIQTHQHLLPGSERGGGQYLQWIFPVFPIGSRYWCVECKAVDRHN